MALSVVIETETDVANLALIHLGQKAITNIESTATNDAILVAVRRLYNIVRTIFFREIAWPTANKSGIDLILLKENTEGEHRFEYLYPTDCKDFLRILSGFRRDNRESEIEFKISVDQKDGTSTNISNISAAEEGVVTSGNHERLDGQLVTLAGIVGTTELNGVTFIVSDAGVNSFKIKSLVTGEYIDTSVLTPYASGGTVTHKSARRILTDQEDSQGEWTFLVTDVSIWAEDMVMAFSYLLAWHLAPFIAGIDRDKIRAELSNNYLLYLNLATKNADSERVEDLQQKSKYTKNSGRRRELPPLE